MRAVLLPDALGNLIEPLLPILHDRTVDGRTSLIAPVSPESSSCAAGFRGIAHVRDAFSFGRHWLDH